MMADADKPKMSPRQEQRRVSFREVAGPNDHPLLAIRKRMKSGDTRHSIRTFGRSESMIIDGADAAAAIREENLLHILEQVEAKGLAALTPAKQGLFTSSPAHTPATPGRRHDITWESEPPMFFPRPPAYASPSASSPNTSPKRKSEALMSPVPHVHLQPRFETPWLADKLSLNLPALESEAPVPFAPYCDANPASDSEGGEEDESSNNEKPQDGEKEKAEPTLLPSATTKLGAMSLSVSTAAQRSTPKQFVRKGMNARCA